jgi:hypothetical protein
MSAEIELLHAYREWHRLARAETKAIQTRNWDLLADCQLAIKDFQSLVSRLTIQARQEWAGAGCNLAEKEQHVHVFVNGLIEITRQNQSMLQAAKTAAQERLEELGEAGRNLKRMQRSYGSLTSAWSATA